MSNVTNLYPERRILFTHTDLDGVGCAVIYAKCFPYVEVCFVDYNEVNEVIMDFISQDQTAKIMISDMSVNKDVAHLLDLRGNVELIDHHATAKWLEDTYAWAMIDTNRCATHLMYQLMSRTFNIEDYREFAELVDNYDRWGGGPGLEPSEQAYELNRLMYIFGQERFYKRFVMESKLTLSPVELAVLGLDKEKEQKYIEESYELCAFLIDSLGYKYVLVNADQYISSLGHALLKTFPEAEYAIMLDFRRNKASLRGRGNVNMGELAKQMGGGGHPKAAGFPLGDTASKLFSACHTCEYKAYFSGKSKEVEHAIYGGEQ